MRKKMIQKLKSVTALILVCTLMICCLSIGCIVCFGNKGNVKASSTKATTEVNATDTISTEETMKEEKEEEKTRVKITIEKPKGWRILTTKVNIKVENDSSDSFFIEKVEAKIGENGSWQDITDDMFIEISENSTIYVQATDKNGEVHTKSRYMECFDMEKPSLNVALSDSGLLTIRGYDNISGVAAFYVNGIKMTEFKNNTLHIRLQAYDSKYQKLTFQVDDKASNLSDMVYMENPFYIDPNSEDDEKSTLPNNAEATDITHATGTVVEKTTTPTKQFYTIQTKSGKTFYMVVNNEETEENAYLLTEVSENDLLNFTNSDSQTLPQAGTFKDGDTFEVVTDSAIPDTEKEKEESTEQSEDTETKETSKKKSEKKNNSSVMSNIVIFALVMIVGVVYYFVKIRKKDKFQTDDEIEAEYEDEMSTEDDYSFLEDNDIEIDSDMESEEEN